MIRKILITGGSGMIGTALGEKLINDGFKVFSVDKKPNKWSNKMNEVNTLVDLRSKTELNKIAHKIDLVIHLAANARVVDLIKDPRLAFDNYLMTYNILEFVKNNKIPKIIFSSSREVYGNSEKENLSEEDVVLEKCESPYASSKIGGESLIYSYGKCYNIDYIVFRFSNVYGRYDLSDRVIPNFILKCKENKDITIYGRGKILNFTYIDDLVEGLSLAINKYDKVKNKSYNLNGNEVVSLVFLAEKIIKKLDSNSSLILKDSRIGEVVKYSGDIKKAKDYFGFSPKTKIEEGIRRTLDWYL